MQEYFTEAVVLNSEPSGDLDGRFSLFTKRFGKLYARAKSVKKITSKLSGHLQPGNLILVRLVEKSGLQVVDALKKKALSHSLSSLFFLNRILPEAEPEREMWEMLLSSNFDWAEALRVLGWDSSGAKCTLCNRTSPETFHLTTQEFFCRNCASKLRQNEVIYIS